MGTEPTFSNVEREVIDITLINKSMYDETTAWKVNTENYVRSQYD